MNLARRIDAVRRCLIDEKADVFIAAKPSNVAYLSGMTSVFGDEPDGVVLLDADRALLFTDSRYEEAATTAAAGTPFDVRVVDGPPLVSAIEVAREQGVSRLAVEDSLPYAQFSSAMERFGGEVVPASGWVEGARCVKDAEEIELIAQAQALADAAFADILGSIRAGRTEREVALELEYAMRRAGSDGVAFPLIVASGPNSALPHAGVTDRVIERGDFVKLDFGARVGGYRSDMTRTVVVGAASPRHRQIYEGVRLANEAGIDAVAAGRTGIEVDAEARAVLDRLGIEGAFRHGLGHGVGLDVHEGPSLSPKGERALESGMVVTVEPGVYVPGFGGVRIEDLVVVEAGGCRVLSTAPKELIEL